MLERLKHALGEYMEERPTMQAHTSQPMTASIGLVKEAAECLEAEQLGKTEAIASEAADIMVWLLVLSGNYGFDLIQTTINKIETNRERFPASFFLDPDVPFEQSYLEVKKRNGER